MNVSCDLSEFKMNSNGIVKIHTQRESVSGGMRDGPSRDKLAEVNDE